MIEGSNDLRSKIKGISEIQKTTNAALKKTMSSSSNKSFTLYNISIWPMTDRGLQMPVDRSRGYWLKDDRDNRWKVQLTDREWIKILRSNPEDPIFRRLGLASSNPFGLNNREANYSRLSTSSVDTVASYCPFHQTSTDNNNNNNSSRSLTSCCERCCLRLRCNESSATFRKSIFSDDDRDEKKRIQSTLSYSNEDTKDRHHHPQVIANLVCQRNCRQCRSLSNGFIKVPNNSKASSPVSSDDERSLSVDGLVTSPLLVSPSTEDKQLNRRETMTDEIDSIDRKKEKLEERRRTQINVHVPY